MSYDHLLKGRCNTWTLGKKSHTCNSMPTFYTCMHGRLKATARSQGWLCYERPAHIKRCPICCSLRKLVVGRQKLVASSTCSFEFFFFFFFFVQLKFVCKNASNFPINGARNDQR